MNARATDRAAAATRGDRQVGPVPVQLLGAARDGRTDAVERAVLRRALGARRCVPAPARLSAVRRYRDRSRVRRRDRSRHCGAVLDVQQRAADDQGPDRLRVGDASRAHLRRDRARPRTHLALLHIVSNALVRCYQLLVSPSVVAHRLRRQATAGAARAGTVRSVYARFVPQSWWPTLYVFALSRATSRTSRSSGYGSRCGGSAPCSRAERFSCSLSASSGLVELAYAHRATPGAAALLVVTATAFSARGLGCWRQPARAVLWITGSSLLAMMAVIFVAGNDAVAMLLYGGSVATACALGYIGFASAAIPGGIVTRFAGLWERRPTAALVAFVGALGLAGAPPADVLGGRSHRPQRARRPPRRRHCRRFNSRRERLPRRTKFRLHVHGPAEPRFSMNAHVVSGASGLGRVIGPCDLAGAVSVRSTTGSCWCATMACRKPFAVFRD